MKITRSQLRRLINEAIQQSLLIESFVDSETRRMAQRLAQRSRNFYPKAASTNALWVALEGTGVSAGTALMCAAAAGAAGYATGMGIDAFLTIDTSTFYNQILRSFAAHNGLIDDVGRYSQPSWRELRNLMDKQETKKLGPRNNTVDPGQSNKLTELHVLLLAYESNDGKLPSYAPEEVKQYKRFITFGFINGDAFHELAKEKIAEINEELNRADVPELPE